MCRNTMGRSLSTYALVFGALTLSACAEVTTAPDSVDLDQARTNEAISSPEPQYVVSWMEDGEVVWHVITPVETAEPVEDFYKRGDPSQIAGTTGYEVVDEATLMLHRDTNTGLVSLVVIYNALNNRPDAGTRVTRAHLENWTSAASHSAESISFPVRDDPITSELPSFRNEIWTMYNAWGAKFTDGWAARNGFEEPFSVQLRLKDIVGLNAIGWVDGDGERVAVPMEDAESRILIGYGAVPAEDPADDTPADDTPPVITATVTGDEGEDGWYTGDVAISWSFVDGESEITATNGCEDATVTEDIGGSTFTCEASSAGGDASESVTVKRDATPAEIVFAGNVRTYDVDEQVQITCDVSDATSGIASEDCPGADAPAWSFHSGSEVLEGWATDNAGNEAASSTSFDVVPTAEGICALTGEWISSPGVANALCKKLTGSNSASGNGKGKGNAKGNSSGNTGQPQAFTNQVNDLRGEWLTDEQADLLIEFAGTL